MLSSWTCLLFLCYLCCFEPKSGLLAAVAGVFLEGVVILRKGEEESERSKMMDETIF